MGFPDKKLSGQLFSPAVSFTRKAITWWLGILYFFIPVSFYLGTYDSAQVKITFVQMGGTALLALWGCLLLLEGRKAFKKEDFAYIAPFLVYLAYVVLSFFNVPYKGPSIDDFIRYIFYISVAMIVIVECNEKAVSRITKLLVAATCVITLYGLIQVIDTRFFPPNAVGPGLDPFLWRGAFGPRVFSTFGNPNFYADFALLIFFVLIAQFLKTKSYYLLPFIVVDLANLYFTETKGAWLGFGAASFIFVLIYAIYFMRDYFRKNYLKVIVPAIVVPILCIGLVVFYASKRMDSVNFRVFTWLSTWEMIETKPLVGTGLGCFKVIYPAFRRPQIFHIEGKHNTETDHAENEYLEQWMDNGLIGFGIFLWLILFTVFTGLRALGGRLAPGQAGGRAPPAAYDLLGYLTAFTGMLVHNFCDVSMRFVSSGVFLGLLAGLVINLSRGKALYEIHAEEETSAAHVKPAAVPLWQVYLTVILRLLAVCGMVYLAFRLLGEFSDIQKPLNPAFSTGEVLQWFLGWIVFGGCVLGLLGVFIRVAWLSSSKMVFIVMMAMLVPINYFWGYFKADVYHNIAIYHSKNKMWDGALSYYDKSIQYNPYFIMSSYFRANVFKDKFDMERKYMPEWGDKNEVARTDFERAMDLYEQVRKVAPNYVQMHYQVGELYIKMANYYRAQNNIAESDKYLRKALDRFNLYHNLDPVFPYNYYQRGYIYTMLNQLDKAEAEYEENINPKYKDTKNESAMAYVYLGRAKLQLGKVAEAEAALKRALELDPKDPYAVSNYSMIQQIKAGHPPVPVPINTGSGIRMQVK